MNYNETINSLSSSAHSKSEFLKNTPLKFKLSAIYAGVFIGLGVLVSFTTNAVFISGGSPHFGKLLNACVFSIALILIIFTNTELFTGNSMVMTIGVLDKKSSIKELLKVLLISWVGNLLGAVFLGFIYSNTGLLENKPVSDFFATMSKMKVSIPPIQLFSRAVLCNFVVCLALMVSTRTKSDTSKILITFLLIITFVITGFEHSIANMTVFSVAILGKVGSISIYQALYALFMATLGNFVGGAILLGCGVFSLKR